MAFTCYYNGSTYTLTPSASVRDLYQHLCVYPTSAITFQGIYLWCNDTSIADAGLSNEVMLSESVNQYTQECFKIAKPWNTTDDDEHILVHRRLCTQNDMSRDKFYVLVSFLNDTFDHTSGYFRPYVEHATNAKTKLSWMQDNLFKVQKLQAKPIGYPEAKIVDITCGHLDANDTPHVTATWMEDNSIIVAVMTHGLQLIVIDAHLQSMMLPLWRLVNKVPYVGWRERMEKAYTMFNFYQAKVITSKDIFNGTFKEMVLHTTSKKMQEQFAQRWFGFFKKMKKMRMHAQRKCS
jgi:hypothetical protein